jgi:hypothetical protein
LCHLPQECQAGFGQNAAFAPKQRGSSNQKYLGLSRQPAMASQYSDTPSGDTLLPFVFLYVGNILNCPV